jgi:hypothetical protein
MGRPDYKEEKYFYVDPEFSAYLGILRDKH